MTEKDTWQDQADDGPQLTVHACDRFDVTAGSSPILISVPHSGRVYPPELLARARLSASQMRMLADLADKYGHGELRISHEQNVVLPHVHKSDLPALHAALKTEGLATANIGLVSDIIACPGMDYCALATARSIPVAQELSTHFKAIGLEEEIGQLKIKISGCINACGHHHVGHIGILGLDRAGVENYQITLGGDHTEHAAIGDKVGPGFAYDQVVPAIERLLRAYIDLRADKSETFIDAFRRVGPAPFKAALYPEEAARDAA